MPTKRRPKPKSAPSESYAARVARGLRPISVGLPEETIADLDALAEKRGESRRDVLVAAIEMLKEET